MKDKPVLFSYIVRHDDGVAPNPFHGICTLTICKPVIRRTAKVGDWIVGLGSANSPIGNMSGKVIYAMRITEKLILGEYDSFCRAHYPEKIPNWDSNNFKEKVGDCIYDYSDPSNPKIRKSVHNEKNMDKDLRGKNSLISNEFYYFGNDPIPLPEHLKGIIKQGQGHKSKSNEDYIEDFISWIRTQKRGINGDPQMKKEMISCNYKINCSEYHLKEAEEDERIGETNC